MKHLIYLSFVCIVFGIIFTKCSNKDESTSSLTEGILMDWSNFDGCGWVIELGSNDHTILEPNNLQQFNMSLSDSLPVRFIYEIASDQTTSCMAGTVVKLLEISVN